MRAQPPPRLAARRIEIRGTVQGVGFRPWVYRLAHADHIRGRVRNDAAGVTIEAWGSPGDLDAFCRHLQASPPAAASIRELRCHSVPDESALEGPESFDIVASCGAEEHRLSIPPDLATCSDCLREIHDPDDRRYRYPFTNCTHCGPRFTLALDSPYDRRHTTMSAFAMCPDCAREYSDPLDRRFHAQPNACPVCGPQLWLETQHPSGDTMPGTAGDTTTLDPLRQAVARLRRGEIVAVKGLGGWHLACLADCDAAVAELRRRKRRSHKPFAVMVQDLEHARRLAVLSRAEEDVLTSVERPVVLVRRRSGIEPGNAVDGAVLSPHVAPDLDLLGLMLPYTPLHHLLMEDVGRPLVMTSGNLSEEPIAYLDDEAAERLGPLADAFVMHDRPIARPCDDSVARVIAGVRTVFRRSRGFTPRPLPVSEPFQVPILACGAHLKNAVCLGVGDAAWFGPHVGDLESPEAAAFLDRSVAEMEHLLGVVPEVVVHDLHPDIYSSRFARRHAAAVGARTLAVQHHHAHVLSLLAEHGHEGPVLGVAFDGVGLGDDGTTAWGGELLWCAGGRYRRVATLRPLRLAGGDAAVREPWRSALALLDDAFDSTPPLEDLELFCHHSARTIDTARVLIERGVHAPASHGAGRYFDAVGALLLARSASHYEGHLAMALESLARPAFAAPAAARPFHVHLADPPSPGEPPRLVEIDLRPTLRSLVDGLLCDVDPAVLAARFHRSAAHGIALAVARLAESDAEIGAAHRAGDLTLGLSGGCFQNDLFARCTVAELECLGVAEVLRHGQVPPGDGGLALGQLLAAHRLLGAATDETTRR